MHKKDYAKQTFVRVEIQRERDEERSLSEMIDEVRRIAERVSTRG